MRQLLYISSSATRGQPIDVAPIMAQSVRNNRRDRVTGLLYTDGVRFLQVLEGEDADVQRVFDRIRADPRHVAIVVLHNRAVEARQFGDWAMAKRGANDSADAFDARMATMLDGASDAVRGTFLGLVAARRAA
ncbi:BLUF domain-containing protein [Sphingomonas sp. SUN019]|uniref:BLUF domain-containing protein n=1 Tax=Sphingomonas sp. SUN019 TaxID=2937788 RepID=UPI0021642903|nr:BLUF domain-containing protein [Sphingomonas sp. SUN019]UVO52067.1 BLUF domain-containing protein [Sphingomonas sp. SUN019]